MYNFLIKLNTCFFIKNDDLLERYNKVWVKVSELCNIIKKGFDSEPVYNQKYVKPKIESH